MYIKLIYTLSIDSVERRLHIVLVKLSIAFYYYLYIVYCCPSKNKHYVLLTEISILNRLWAQTNVTAREFQLTEGKCLKSIIHLSKPMAETYLIQFL